MELAFRESLRLGHTFVGTEHVLLALLDEEAGAGVVSDLGATKERTEELVVELLASLPLDGLSQAAMRSPDRPPRTRSA